MTELARQSRHCFRVGLAALVAQQFDALGGGHGADRLRQHSALEHLLGQLTNLTGHETIHLAEAVLAGLCGGFIDRDFVFLQNAGLVC